MCVYVFVRPSDRRQSDELAASRDAQTRLHAALSASAHQLSAIKADKERAEASAAQLPALQSAHEQRWRESQVHVDQKCMQSVMSMTNR